MSNVKIVLIGFGNVGRALARLLLSKRQSLSQGYQIEWQVVGISTRNHGAAFNPDGLDLERAIALRESNESLSELSTRDLPTNGVDFLRTCPADVLFENTSVDYQTGQPAIDHIQTALESNMHAITANKGPVVHAYHKLTDLAHSQNRLFRFESTVMDGAPIFSTWRQSLPAADLHAFRGVLNSTTNLILTLMEEGKSFHEAVSYAQAIGIAETDPRGDTQGWDSAIKVAALSTVLMDIPLKPDQIDRKGIEDLTLEDLASARAEGKRWKLICQAMRQDDKVQASVRPEKVPVEDQLFHVQGTSSAITFQSDVLGDLTIIEDDPGPHTTAYGLMADFVNAIQSTLPGSTTSECIPK